MSASRSFPAGAPAAGAPRVGAGRPADEVNPVGALRAAMLRSAGHDRMRPTRRQFDAQYWACWVVAIVWPTLLAYLLITR